MTGPLRPGATIGIVGGGQLGRMLAMAAGRLGYHAAILDPDGECPAAEMALHHVAADYDDEDGLAELADRCDVITYEFENVPVETVRRLARQCAVFPAPLALEVSQDRLTEKRFLAKHGIATARFARVDSQSDLEKALAAEGGRGLLKTRRLGYDGKGQRLFAGPGDDPAGAFDSLGGLACILEEIVAFDCEISVVTARAADGDMVSYEPSRNLHRDGILRRSSVPARVGADSLAVARRSAERLAEALGYVGVIALECFVLGDGAVVANEFAPRVHNSGHWTEAACTVSQFEQHVRAIAGLPLGGTGRHSNAVMDNLIGAEAGQVATLCAEPNALVHLYGKRQARPGRKMGHVTRIAPLSDAEVDG